MLKGGDRNLKKTMQKMIIPNDILLAEVVSLVEEGKSVVLMTKGASMHPFIIGEKDSVRLMKPETLYPGLIVLAEYKKDRYVLHRLISVEDDRVVLMGDGNLKGCESCRRTDVKAVAVSVLKADGNEVDCLSRKHLRRAALWHRLLPIRRWLLAFYRRCL